MKIREPTNVTMTSMHAVNGSSTQPRRRVVVPKENQSKLETSRKAPCSECSVAAKAQHDRRKEKTIEPIARVAAVRRRGCLHTEMIAAASSGRIGMSQRFFVIQLMSAFQAIDAF